MNKFKIIYLISGISLLSSLYPVFASVETNGYLLPLPNRFWPFYTTTIAASGTEVQQNSRYTNPDVFCETQEGKWRVPSLGEWNAYWTIVNPNDTPGMGHWSHYYNYDVTQPRVPRASSEYARAVGGVFSEWGGLAAYGSNWDKTDYWMVEPVKGTNAANIGREGANVNGAYLANKRAVTEVHGVVCVTDLVPSPLIPEVNT